MGKANESGRLAEAGVDRSPIGPRRWGFIGAGKMATALIRGMLRDGTPAESISASDPDPSARASLVGETGISTHDSNLDIARNSDVLVLAVKPQSMAGVLAELRPAITRDHLVVSVAAGVSMATLARGLGEDRRLARAMPNTPALVGEGAAGYCLGPASEEGDEAIVAGCLAAVGKAFRVPEGQLDAVTGLSGSGPAFVYVMIEALADGGVRVGLPREVAQALAAQTVLGAAKMVLETGQHPGFLKDQVTSPAGTTIAGLHALERGGVRAALIDAVEAAYSRSVELARPRRQGRGPGMKLGLISDVHGDLVALELAWAHLTILGADRIVCAGDLVGYGPHPDRVVAFLAEHGVDSVRGNHDRWAVERASGLPGIPSTFGGGMPSAEAVETLEALPADRLVVDGPRVGVIVHGSPGDDMDFVTRKTHPPYLLDRWLQTMGASLLVVGHTHRPMLYRSEFGLVINPGSVISAPVVSTSRTFALLDWESSAVTFHDVESGEPVEVVAWGDRAEL